jgi:hypothetical protein
VRLQPHRTAWTAGLMALVLYGATADGDPDELFRRIKSHMSEHLAHLPNYTCHETIERYIRTGTSLRHLDEVRLDVIFTGQGELFSRGEGSQFQDQPIGKLVSWGTISNGAMGSHIDLLLSQDEAEFKYSGTGKKEGHRSLRFDLIVPIEKSHFQVKHNGVEGIAGYKGSLWVDADTYDPVRVDFKVDRIPPSVGVQLIEESLHYKKMTIGNSEFDLPARSELAATDQEGTYTMNQTKLDGCREFTANSVVQFGAASEGSAAREKPDHR